MEKENLQSKPVTGKRLIHPELSIRENMDLLDENGLSDFSDIAKQIHGTKFGYPKPAISSGQHWQNVKTEADIVEHYKIYYPEWPETVARGIAAFIASRDPHFKTDQDK